MPSIGAEFLGAEDVRSLGLRSVGRDVLIHATVIIVGLENLSVGDCSRIDAHTVIIANGPVSIGRNVHIGASCYIAGAGGVTMDDFSGFSQGVRVYSVSDDYSGISMTNPTIPAEFTNVKKAAVFVGRHAIIGSGSVILPGSTIAQGAAVGALSLVKGDVEPWTINVGCPVRNAGARHRDALSLEKRYMDYWDNEMAKNQIADSITRHT